MHTDVGLHAMSVKFFFVFPFRNDSDFSDFTLKCKVSKIYTENWMKLFSVWGKSYATYIIGVLSCDLDI